MKLVQSIRQIARSLANARANMDLLSKVKFILGFMSGGAHKRIDENRELLELLQSEAPDFLESHSWVEGWLASHDAFFVALASDVPITEGRYLSAALRNPDRFPRPWPSQHQFKKTELMALREAFRLMNLDPTKVASFFADNCDHTCKAILFNCVGLDESKLVTRVGEKSNLSVWRTYWNQLQTQPATYPTKKHVPESWIAHAYPLQQVTIRLQGTRHSDKDSIVGQLETVLERLKDGDTSGYDHDDDFGYAFEYVEAAPGPSFFDEPAGSI